LRLGQILEDQSLIDRAHESIISFHTILTKYPFAMPALVSAYMMYDKGIKQVSHHMIPTQVEATAADKNSTKGGHFGPARRPISSEIPSSGERNVYSQQIARTRTKGRVYIVQEWNSAYNN